MEYTRFIHTSDYLKRIGVPDPLMILNETGEVKTPIPFF
jgi:hypothetical protein